MAQPPAEPSETSPATTPRSSADIPPAAPAGVVAPGYAATAWLALAAAVVAGLATWLLSDSIHPGYEQQQVRALFRASPEAAEQARSFERLHRESARANIKNGALSFGALGGLLGLGLGLAGGLFRATSGRAVLTGIFAALLGAAAGAAIAVGLLPKIPQEAHELADNAVLLFLIYRGPWCALAGALGLLLGFGLGGGLARREPGGPVLGGLLGLLLGTCLGALPPYILMPWHWYAFPDLAISQEMLSPFLMHLALWCPLAGAAGLAFGFGRFGLRPLMLLRTTLGAILGAAVGTMLYEVIGATMFPMAATADPWSATTETRLLARLAVTLFTAAGVVLLAQPARAVKPAAAQPALSELSP
jgi:hypothetical protein